MQHCIISIDFWSADRRAYGNGHIELSADPWSNGANCLE